MNPILTNVLYIVGAIIATIIFTKGREVIIGRAKNRVFGNGFDTKKALTGFFSLFNPILWVKDIISLINLRKLIIFGVIFSMVYWWGMQGKPITMDIGYGKEAYIRLNGNFLHIDKKGLVYLEDKNGTKLKQISVKDIPALRRKLAPIGIEFKPIAVLGYGFGDRQHGFEGGVGLSLIRYWQWRLETFVTQRGIYVGTSYKLTKYKMENSAIGMGVGKGWRGDNRIMLYFRMEF